MTARAIRISVPFVYVLAALVSMPAAAQHDHTHAATTIAAQNKSAEGAMVDGEVRKVDKAAKKITLRHAPIPNLDMPEMTMVFRVTDDKMLDQVKAGDKVKFAADNAGGQLTVTKIEPVR